MPSAPDVDGNGTVDTTVTLIVGSGEELVWQDGAAGALQPGQEEVNVGDDGANELLFGNFLEGSIHGFKFEDVDADGVYTPGTDQPLAVPTLTIHR